VFDKEAGVFDDQEAGGVCLSGCVFVCNSLLEPETFGVNTDGGIGDGRDEFGAAKNVDDVDGDGNIFEARVGFLAEDHGFVGIDGDDGVADGLKIGGNAVGGSGGVGRQTNDSDGLGLKEEVGDWVGGFYRVFREVDSHDAWMTGLLKW
jgi:hypothetical protein